jgi:hypothetical protein
MRMFTVIATTGLVVSMAIIGMPQARADTPSDWAASICNVIEPGTGDGKPHGTYTLLPLSTSQNPEGAAPSPLRNASWSGICTLYANRPEGGCVYDLTFYMGIYSSGYARETDLAASEQTRLILGYATKSDGRTWSLVTAEAGCGWPAQLVADVPGDLAPLKQFGFTIS